MADNLEYDDKDLVARLRDTKTCRVAFGDVVKMYSEPLYWQIRRMVINHDDANDILQNTFLKAWNSIENFRGDAKLSTWLYKIAINESLTFLEKESKRNAVSIDDATANVLNAIESDKFFDGDEIQLKLRKAIASLPEKQRLVFNMRYYDEMKYEQMSEILGTSVGALKASYHLAVKKIESFFSDDD
ncbi:MAG: sigma-70 family RNA polymerase sigma factor [Paramuribaculum sp.]|nr:sigma-70 family RNA polymerase sigma factor [Paramuribaculum sp.]